MNAGRLNRLIRVERATLTDDGYGNSIPTWAQVGGPIYAARNDLSDGERLNLGQWSNKLVTRFLIRDTAGARNIRRTDRIVHEGMVFDIAGIKEVPPGRAFLEITAETEGAP